MATLVLQVAGGALGAMVGGPVGAIAGRALGGLAGAMVDSSLLGASARASDGPRLTDVQGLASTEGSAIPRVYGRARIGGELIWATRVEEVVSASTERNGGIGAKTTGLGGSGAKAGVTYSYFANLAVGLCVGPVAFVRRIWVDGKELDQTTLAMRFHNGDESQAPDPLIVAKEGAENAPAYRGLAYVVFERLPLADFSNRIPQFSFEVVRPVNGLCQMIRALDLIPGATEFGYDPMWRVQIPAPGVSEPENRNQLVRFTDITASLDAMQALCPNLERVALVVSWFGDDLRAGNCRIEPRVERHLKQVLGEPWSVGGMPREAVRLVSEVDGRPAYGGTPADMAVLRLVADLKARGIGVVFYPFVMMDVPAGNGLPDPRGAGEQPPFPWRGRITCDPAPGRPGSPDGSEAAATQVRACFGQANPAQFLTLGPIVTYLGSPEWSLRRLVLHYAFLMRSIGGVEGFIVGSELVGLTRVRGAAGYPAVDALSTLAADVRAVLGAGCRIVYAADWTEYGAHVRNGAADVSFPLDPLWASPHIDAVGIDFYPPISDWRDGSSHLDAAEARSIYDIGYLAGRVGAGGDHDWYYASEADRLAQVRTPITDGAYGKPWVFRAKDLAGWWSNTHVERAGGIETAPTAWVPRSKPIWLTEIGVPAVDKGTNGPNVFPDPKSSENAAPPLSRGSRDDLIQLRGLEAIITRFDPASPGHQAGWNPWSESYGGHMVDPGHIFVWAWDARPFPAFPSLGQVWADGANWPNGHWITGRIEGVELDLLVRAIVADYGLAPVLADGPIAVDGFLDGYVIDRPMSARDALEPLGSLFGFDAVASAGTLRFAGRGERVAATFSEDDYVPDREGRNLTLRRAQESELPREVRVGFTDGDRDYRRAAAASRRLAGGSRREAGSDVAVVTHRAEAQRLADIWLQGAWIARETVNFSVSPRQIAPDVGDVLAIGVDGGMRTYRITRITEGAERRIEARAVEPSLADAVGLPQRPLSLPAPRLPGVPLALVLDLPLAMSAPEVLQHMAVFADPWPGRVSVFRSVDGARYDLLAQVELSALVGQTTSALGPGQLWRFDHAASFTATMRGGALASLDDMALLAGRNSFAVLGPDGAWEVIAAGEITLVGTGTYRFSRLLRGLGGSEALAGRTVAPGATIVGLDSALLPLTRSVDDIGRAYRYRIGPAGRDHAEPGFVELSAAPGMLALRPYAPVRPTARRTSGGIAIGFVRRSRIGGDAWELPDVPLSEEAERYEIDIYAGGAVVRTFASDTPGALYASADEIADFGSARSSLDIGVCQISPRVGRGFPLRATVPIV